MVAWHQPAREGHRRHRRAARRRADRRRLRHGALPAQHADREPRRRSSTQLARTDVAGAAARPRPAIERSAADRPPSRTLPPTEYFVAIYGPDGDLLSARRAATASPSPPSPRRITLEQAQSQRARRPSRSRLRRRRVGVPRQRSTSARARGRRAILYTQMVALPLASINQVVAHVHRHLQHPRRSSSLIASALLTRWLVTLTFRSLGQVESTADGDRGGRLQPAHDRHRADDDRGRPPQDRDQRDARTAWMPRSRSAIRPCGRCAASSATRATSCAPRSSRCAATPSSTGWARSRATTTSRRRWTASRRRRCAWACSSRTCSPSRASTSAATWSSPRSTCGRSRGMPRSTCARHRRCARSR